LFATLIAFGDDIIHTRLQHKRMPDDTENYYAPDLSLDYLHITKSNLGKTVVRIEKRALAISNQIAQGYEASLSRKERNFFATYMRARKIGLLPEVPADVLTQFSAESMEKILRTESNARYEKMLEKALDHFESDVGGDEYVEA
ncbi:MAG: hypothetical protein IJB94_02215, partial [Clostridia bacterium]|nr:hypothetical protein [Clostridia bacterium]